MTIGALKDKLSINIRNLNSPANVIFLIIAGLFVVHWVTVESLAHFWSTDFTYSHGILIAPLSLYIIWRKRTQINAIGYAPSIAGLILFMLLNLVWLAAYFTDIEIVQQFDFLAMIAAIFLAILGWQQIFRLSFPLLFPLIAMPLWSWLEPMLQYLTTHIVAFSLSVVGVPVFVEAHFLRIPEGVFSIEEVCAGLRYLLAAVAISLVYVHFNMKKTSTALLFLIFSVSLSLLVNWVRVFSVIVAGHLTNMQHSLVHDHANFGWWLFAFTLIPIFWVGYWSVEKEQINRRGIYEQEVVNRFASNPQTIIGTSNALVGVVVIALVFPLFGYYLKSQNKMMLSKTTTNIVEPTLSNHWQGPIEATQDNLNPQFLGADTKYSANYSKDGKKVLFYTAMYTFQEQGKELISWNNSLFDKSLWTIYSKQIRKIKLNSDTNKYLQVEESIVRNPSGKTRVLWHWYTVAGVNTVKPVMAKILIIKNLFSKNKLGSSIYLLATDVNISVDQARQLLIEYLQENKITPNL